jgi:hypothetical protein
MHVSAGLQKRIRTVFACCVLEFGALIGLPMRPKEIDNLLRTMNQPEIARTMPDESDTDDGMGEVSGVDGRVEASIDGCSLVSYRAFRTVHLIRTDRRK